MTAETPETVTRITPRSDTKVALMCVASAFAMGGMAYAAVPLYQMFCQVTGLGGTTQKAEKPSEIVLDRLVTVRFDANVSPKLGWSFEPVQRTVEAHIYNIYRKCDCRNRVELMNRIQQYRPAP